MNSCYHGMNSFHPKCTKHGKMLIIQLRKEVPKKFFYIIDCHHKCEFWEISLTLNSKKYVEWIHSMVPWIHSMVEWIQAQGGMNLFLVEWIHSTLGIPILLKRGNNLVQESGLQTAKMRTTSFLKTFKWKVELILEKCNFHRRWN